MLLVCRNLDKHLMTGHKGNSEFCFPKTFNVPWCDAKEKLNSLFPMVPVCFFILQSSKNRTNCRRVAHKLASISRCISPSCLSRKFKLFRGSLWVLTHDTWYVLPSNWRALLSWEVKQYFWSSLKLLRQSFGSHNFYVFSKTVEGPLVLSAFIITDISGIYKFSSYLFWGDDLFSTGFNFLLHSGITCSCDQDCQPNTGRDRPTSRAIFRSTYRSVREK